MRDGTSLPFAKTDSMNTLDKQECQETAPQ